MTYDLAVQREQEEHERLNGQPGCFEVWAPIVGFFLVVFGFIAFSVLGR